MGNFPKVRIMQNSALLDPRMREYALSTGWTRRCNSDSARPEGGVASYMVMFKKNTKLMGTPVRAARGSRRRVGWALFRLLRGLSMAAPQQARVVGYPARFSRPAPGRWSCVYHAYKALIQRYAQK